jgi:parallel beta-helix repeat protein
MLAAILLLACAQGRTHTDAQGPLGSASLSVSDFGARGDGQALDTAAIQAAVDALPPGGVLRFPPGTYRIEADKGLRLKDDMRLDLGHAIVVGANVDGAKCRLLEIQGRRNVTISGGTLVGSRGGSPEWGMGILASDASDLVIENLTLRDFYFDGIILTGNRGCRRVALRGVVSENNRRTGLAVVHAYDVTVEDSTFAGTRGQSPEAGVNCEPNRGEEVRDVHFRRCTFRGNANVGLYLHRALGVRVANASVQDSLVEANGYGIVASGVDDIIIRNNRVRGHRGRKTPAIVVGESQRPVIASNRLDDNYRGIFSAGATAAEVRENTVVGTGAADGAREGDAGDGIVCLGLRGPLAEACVVADNTVRRCAGSGIVAQLVSRVRLEDNSVEDVGQRGIFLRTTSGSEVRGNSVSAVGQEAPGRYDAIELGFASSDNTIATNVIRLGAGTRQAIGICAACRGNQVTGNVVLPY